LDARAGSLAGKLIDYDRMWVPALASKPSGEVGHPNYQHPQRLGEGTYRREVDRFPLLVVATALRALAAGGKPLWDRYDNGDNLLFKEADLKAPARSPLFAELLRMGDRQVHELTVALIDAVRMPPEQVPLLDTPVPASPGLQPAAAALPGEPPPAAASWVADALAARAASDPAAARKPGASGVLRKTAVEPSHAGQGQAGRPRRTEVIIRASSSGVLRRSARARRSRGLVIGAVLLLAAGVAVAAVLWWPHLNSRPPGRGQTVAKRARRETSPRTQRSAPATPRDTGGDPRTEPAGGDPSTETQPDPPTGREERKGDTHQKPPPKVAPPPGTTEPEAKDPPRDDTDPVRQLVADGREHMALGQYETALQELSAACRLDRGNAEARRALKELVDKRRSDPDFLVRVVADDRRSLPRETRLAAAVGLGQHKGQADAKEVLRDLIKVLGNSKDDPEVRFQVSFVLEQYAAKLKQAPGAVPALEKVLNEPKEPPTRRLRYQCASLLVALQGAAAGKAVLDVLADRLKDAREGDGRVVAIRGLSAVGVKRVAARQDILRQVRFLAVDAKAGKELAGAASAFLKRLEAAGLVQAPAQPGSDDGKRTWPAQLGPSDPMYAVDGEKYRHKVFPYPMEAGKTYRIDMQSDAFDPWLYLEDPAGRHVEMRNSGSKPAAGGIVTTLTYTAKAAGLYRIIATTRDGRPGRFLLTAWPTGDALTVLFDGKDLSAWRPNDDWHVLPSGLLAGRNPKPRPLVTKRDDYASFRLRVEVGLGKVVRKNKGRVKSNADGAVIFRRPFRAGGEGSYEVAIDGAARKLRLVRITTQAGEVIQRLVKGETNLPPSPWVTLEVLARGRQLEVRVKGSTPIIDQADQRASRSGRVGLWATPRCEFRTVAIQEFGEVAEGKAPRDTKGRAKGLGPPAK
jgi:hypothetical protein